jgi:hypothetical protein
MYEDGIIALVVVGLVAVCAGGAIIGAWVCPQTRPRRVSGYIVDDETDLV